MTRKKREALSDALIVIGGVLLVVGAGMLHPVAGFFAAGLGCIGCGYLLAIGGER